MHFPRTLMLLMALFVAALGRPALAQNHIAAELVPEGAAVPGETVTVAIHFTPDKGWHGYWKNPGDAGYGMDLEWRLPKGWSAGEPEYPVPQTLEIAGLMNHVYEADYAVLVPLSVPRSAAAGPAPIALDAQWLACTDKICVPEQAALTAVVPASGSATDPRFDKWRAAIPALLDRRAAFALTPEKLRLAIPLPASFKLQNPHVFVSETQVVDYAAPQAFSRRDDTLIAEIPRKGLAKSETGVSGILKLDDSGQGVRFVAAPGPVPSGGEAVGEPAGTPAPLWLLLGLALLGGVILNVMPCVFPILSLKAMSLARAGESEHDARTEGLAYSGGVILAVLGLGGLLLALRAAGNEVGWAFQLQEPGVVVFLLVLASAITANLAGLFELPSLSFTRTGGRPSAFATGLLAAFVATPCTGPFMAAAMGAALLLPWGEGLLLFFALGLGLALPFLLLGWVPPLRRMLPRPGKWMDTFRKAMAVPMGLTALALLWLTGRLGGTLFALAALAVALVMVALFVMLGRLQRAGRSPAPALAGAAALLALAVLVLPHVQAAPGPAEQGVIRAEPFSEAALAEARASGKPVFVWFTADWCLTCKVNESVAIEREATRDAFRKAGVAALSGDWTRRDPEITRFLTAHGAAGVPLYLWYPPGGEAQQLPQVLTPDSLIELARQAGRSAS